MTITGTTGEIRVGEGPIFGHSSYQKIPPGDPFVLTYTFDDEKGKQAISEISGGYDYSIGDRKYSSFFPRNQRSSTDWKRGMGVWSIHPFPNNPPDFRQQQERAVRVHHPGGQQPRILSDSSGKRGLLAEERRLALELHLYFARRQHCFLFRG